MKCVDRALRLLVFVAAATALAGASAAAEAPVTRCYHVRDLIIPIPSFDDPPELGIVKPATRPASKPPRSQPQELDALVHEITSQVDPNSWIERGGNLGSINADAKKGELAITQSPENQNAIEQRLAAIREQRLSQITIECRILGGQAVFEQLERIAGKHQWQKDDGYDRWPNTLTDEQVSRLLQVVRQRVDMTLITAPRLTIFNDQRAYVLVSRQTAYVSDFVKNPSSTQPTGYEAKIGRVQSGTVLDCCGSINPDRKGVRLTVRPQLAELLDLTPQKCPHAPPQTDLTIQVPRVGLIKIAATLEISAGETIALRAKSIGPEPAAMTALLLFKPKIILNSDPAAAAPLLTTKP